MENKNKKEIIRRLNRINALADKIKTKTENLISDITREEI